MNNDPHITIVDAFARVRIGSNVIRCGDPTRLGIAFYLGGQQTRIDVAKGESRYIQIGIATKTLYWWCGENREKQESPGEEAFNAISIYRTKDGRRADVDYFFEATVKVNQLEIDQII